MDILKVFAGISAGVKEKGLSAVMAWHESAKAESERLRQETLEAVNAYRQSRAAAVEKISQKIADLTAEGQAAEKEKLRLNASLAIAAAHDDQEGFKTAQRKLEKLETERAVREDMIAALRGTTVFGSEELYRNAEEKHSAFIDFAKSMREIYRELYSLATDQEAMAKKLKETASGTAIWGSDGFTGIEGDEKGERIPEPESGNKLPVRDLRGGSYRIG